MQLRVAIVLWGCVAGATAQWLRTVAAPRPWDRCVGGREDMGDMEQSGVVPEDVFVHPQGLCESASVGAGTRVWAFAHVLFGAQIGADCNICDGAFVESGAVVGDR